MQEPISDIFNLINNNTDKLQDVLESLNTDLKQKALTSLLTQTNSDGNSPLHHAALLGNVTLVEILIAYGADNNAMNSKGQKPLDLAIQSGNTECITLLEDCTKIDKMQE